MWAQLPLRLLISNPTLPINNCMCFVSSATGRNKTPPRKVMIAGHRDPRFDNDQQVVCNNREGTLGKARLCCVCKLTKSTWGMLQGAWSSGVNLKTPRCVLRGQRWLYLVLQPYCRRDWSTSAMSPSPLRQLHSPADSFRHPRAVTQTHICCKLQLVYPPPVIATGDSGDGVAVCFHLRVLASGGCESLQFIPMDDSLPLHDVPTRWSRTPPMTRGSSLSRAMSVGVL